MAPGFYCCGHALVIVDERGRVNYYDDYIGMWLNIKLPESWKALMEIVEAL